MKQAKVDAATNPSKEVEDVRGRNMRQLLLRASRVVNRHVVEGLQARGYSGLRSTHTTLLSNIPLVGGTVTEAAERAGISKQAMGRLAAELESAGYIRVAADPADGRVRLLEFTDAGGKLMLDSLDIMAGLEARYAEAIGAERLTAALEGLRAFLDVEEMGTGAELGGLTNAMAAQRR